MDRIPLIQRRFPFRFYNAALILIATNIGIFFITMISPGIATRLAMQPTQVVVGHRWWEVVTYMFVHASFTHVLLNMLGIFVFGVALERKIGSTEFLVYYLVSGTLAGLFSLAVYEWTGDTQVYLLGASGAVYALLIGAAAYYPTSSVNLYFVLPIRIPYLALIYLAIDVFGAIRGGTGVAHLTHLSGAGFAFLYLVVRLRINPIREFMRSRR